MPSAGSQQPTLVLQKLIYSRWPSWVPFELNGLYKGNMSTIDPEAPVHYFMSTTPITVPPDMPISDARDKMARNQIRHMPVTQDDALVGIISARDILLVEDLSVFGSYDNSVGDIMAREPITVIPSTPLHTVVKTMVNEDVGAVLVIDEGELVGIFTDVDAVVTLDRVLGT